jgi:hypothetical protein
MASDNKNLQNFLAQAREAVMNSTSTNEATQEGILGGDVMKLRVAARVSSISRKARIF